MYLCGYSLQIRFFAFLCIGLSVLGILIGSYCGDKYCSKTDIKASWMASISEDSTGLISSFEFNSDEAFLNALDVGNVNFSIKGSDVMVFLHIQKTGGTQFGRHLVKDLDLERPCVCHLEKKRCECLRPGRSREIWLFSRYSTGWKCGLHADWTELTECVDTKVDEIEGENNNRRYLYVTFLRDPVSRFLSEFRHVQRGATWKHSKHSCDHRLATKHELPSCFEGDRWANVTLDSFTSCQHNLALNRQTRMLADLKAVGCYNISTMSRSDRDRLLLSSAKLNLSKMPFVGITEQQQMSQYLFERTFRMKFLFPFEHYNKTVSSATLKELREEEKEMVLEFNSLDVELYDFALKLFNSRFEKLKRLDDDFKAHYQEAQNSRQTFEWDSLSDEGVEA